MDGMWDALILSSASERWQKVAKIITVVADRLDDGTNLDTIAARIRALADEGRLEAKGDLSQWRFSEVRRTRSGSKRSQSVE